MRYCVTPTDGRAMKVKASTDMKATHTLPVTSRRTGYSTVGQLYALPSRRRTALTTYTSSPIGSVAIATSADGSHKGRAVKPQWPLRPLNIRMVRQCALVLFSALEGHRGASDIRRLQTSPVGQVGYEVMSSDINRLAVEAHEKCASQGGGMKL